MLLVLGGGSSDGDFFGVVCACSTDFRAQTNTAWRSRQQQTPARPTRSSDQWMHRHSQVHAQLQRPFGQSPPMAAALSQPMKASCRWRVSPTRHGMHVLRQGCRQVWCRQVSFAVTD